jgi:acetylornithine deacetylase/succinyl-diaminopimelate desuccinylase-like protein
MSDPRKDALHYLQANRARFIDELKEYVSIPSISTDPTYQAEVNRAAEWTANHLRKLGINSVEILPTGGHPVVYGEWLGAGPGAQTMLCTVITMSAGGTARTLQRPLSALSVRREPVRPGASDMKGEFWPPWMRSRLPSTRQSAN